MGVNAGALDREVTIEQTTSGKGASGFPVDTWTTLDVEWMRKEDMRGGEKTAYGQLVASQLTRWTLYYRDDMDPESVEVPKSRRLRYRGRIYDIVTATLLGREDGIVLDTLARVS